MGATLAAGPVQVGYELVLSDGMKVLVRYLANPGERWVNQHRVNRMPGVELCVLVILEVFEVAGSSAFPLALHGRFARRPEGTIPTRTGNCSAPAATCLGLTQFSMKSRAPRRML